MNLKKLQKEAEKKMLEALFGHDKKALGEIQNRETKAPDKKADKKEIDRKLMESYRKTVNQKKEEEEEEEEDK